MLLPLVETAVAPEPRVVTPLPTGNERILLVDDEKALAELGKKMLKRFGYEVTAKTSSLEALETFRAQPHRYDLVVTDMTMPNMTGAALSRELLRIRPDIPIILCTGYSEIITEDKAKEMGIDSLVMKPFALREVAETVRRALDHGAGSNPVTGP